MNTEQRLDKLETTVDALRKAMGKLQPLPTLTDEHVTQLLAAVTDEHSPEVVHPIAKPKKKLIDMSKLPIGARTNRGRIMGRSGLTECYSFSFGEMRVSFKDLRVKPMNQWEVLQDGDVIPEGLIYQADCGYSENQIVFRITGVMPNYTDDPSEAV